MSGFEYFIPEVLLELYPDWKYESLDGVVPLVAQKIGEREALFFGLSYLITDQKLAPILIQLQILETEDCVNWLECRIGEKGPHGMQRWPNRAFEKQLRRLEGKQDQIDWAYWITFGEKL